MKTKKNDDIKLEPKAPEDVDIQKKQESEKLPFGGPSMNVGGAYRKKFGDKASTPLQLVKLEQNIEILSHLNVQKTSTLMHFRNFHNEVLEGELVFPLPDDATICGFGFDIDGQIVDGVVVEKQKARIAFESDVRSRATGDALVEHVEGNVFKTRIYPMEPNGRERIIKFEYLNELNSQEDELYCFIPLDFKQNSKLEKVSITINSNKNINLNFQTKDGKIVKKQLNDKSVTLKLKDVKDYISLNVNIKKEMEECIFIEESSINGNYYFFINDSVEITTCESKIKGKKVAILWDSSHSRGLDSRSIKTDILFMEEFLKINNECSLDIIQFHHLNHLLPRNMTRYYNIWKQFNMMEVQIYWQMCNPSLKIMENYMIGYYYFQMEWIP